MDAGIPMAPTIFAKKGKRSPAKLLAEIKDRGERLLGLFNSSVARFLNCPRVEDLRDEAVDDGFFPWLLQAQGRGAALDLRCTDISCLAGQLYPGLREGSQHSQELFPGLL